MKNFGLLTRLKSVEVQKFLQVRNCIPQNKLQKRLINYSVEAPFQIAMAHTHPKCSAVFPP